MEIRRRGGGKSDVSSSSGSPQIGYVQLHKKQDSELLGFRHWLLLIAIVGVIYGAVVYLHRKMPEVVGPDDYTRFSEVRARALLKKLSGLGPRPSGSDNLEKLAYDIVHGKLKEIGETVKKTGANRFEIDVQRPTGCFDLKFLSSFTLCYYKVTNIVARIGPKAGPAKQALLLNCHYDTMPDTPGATDDAVSCTILMDVLDVLARSKEALDSDIVFLFNGAEENFLQGAHGFIEQHPWRYTVRAFINLEGTGSGGREILFQSGPGNSWLLQTYLEAAPHPHCSVMAQEVFQSGIIPSDTDFRIFRDHGHISGLDIAYTKNGWVYHTEFDEEWRIEPGAIQRAGENIVAVVKAIVKSPYLKQAGHFEEANRWVFYDVVGLFTVYYSLNVAEFLNIGVIVAVLILVLYRLSKGFYSIGDLVTTFVHHTVALMAMLLTLVLIILFVNMVDLVMCWYKMPELVGGVYVFPLLLVGCTVHTRFAEHKKPNSEIVHYDSILIFLSSLLLAMTYFRLGSAFFVFNYVFFPLLREPLIFLLGKLGVIQRVTPGVAFATQMICFAPNFFFAAYAISQCIDFFVPVMGRLGNAINPEYLIGPMGLVIASTFVFFISNLIYASRRMSFFLKCSIALYAFFVALLLTTKLGVPYEYSKENPRLRRIIALHANRTIYNFDGQLESADTGLFIHSLDYRGARDLPAHSFLQGSSRPNCTGILDEYCRLPYYTAVHELFPAADSLWVPVPTTGYIPDPIKLTVIEKQRIGANQLNITFELRGGYDKMSLHITPLAGYELKKWSFTDFKVDYFGKRTTYFVFLAYGFEKPQLRSFWILLENPNTSTEVHDPKKAPNLEIAVASHHAHGRFQDSDTLTQLRQLIAQRRQTPEMAIGWWRWGMTMIGGISQIVIHVV